MTDTYIETAKESYGPIVSDFKSGLRNAGLQIIFKT